MTTRWGSILSVGWAVTQLQHALRDFKAMSLEDQAYYGMEVRLRAYGEGDTADAEVLWGDPAFDTDHTGWWGSSVIDDVDADLYAIAHDLIDQVLDATEA